MRESSVSSHHYKHNLIILAKGLLDFTEVVLSLVLIQHIKDMAFDEQGILANRVSVARPLNPEFFLLNGEELGSVLRARLWVGEKEDLVSDCGSTCLQENDIPENPLLRRRLVRHEEVTHR